ncbi:terpene synthase family protein [Chitinophaga solisilvae]|uniref:Terpene synthase n=1 Tax=Chitinophaga solisilvae TaxID=1233460 RepID=A0A9Q5GS63_9BACT|nr:hypothetical protein [Chitinophaga solisilvae]NSL86134.1 hypothetical protein [Chitinophaga solisilvae]
MSMNAYETFAKVVIPRLYCPFPTRISPYTDKVAANTYKFLHDYQLLETKEAEEHFATYKMAWMTCRTMPDADFDLLCCIDNFYSWLFVLDEQLDHVTPATAYIREENYIRQLIEGFVEALRNNAIPKDNKFFHALSDIGARLQKMTRASWQSQFQISVQATFEAAIWEAYNNKHPEHHPAVVQYMHMRQFFSAANIGTDINELATGVELPMYVLQHPDIMYITELARRVVCWANDLFSLNKELQHGDEHNLVMMLKHQHQYSLNEAIQKAASIHDAEMREFVTRRSRLADFGEDLNRKIKKYIDGLETMIAGFFYWSIIDTPRYNPY